MYYDRLRLRLATKEVLKQIQCVEIGNMSQGFNVGNVREKIISTQNANP